MVWICSTCGSSDVEGKAYVKINTGEISGDIMFDHKEGNTDNWCCNCEEHTGIIEETETIN